MTIAAVHDVDGVPEPPPADLAVFGAPPAFAEPLHVGRPNLGDRARLHARLDEILDRRWLTNGGPCVEAFERAIAARLGVRHVLATCNATVALEIAIHALKLAGEVIVPGFTFVATAHALQWQRVTPVFCDVDPATHNIDPDRIEALVTPRTTGILGVHLWGRPCDTRAIEAIAARRGLRVVFDAAHAFDVEHRGRMIGGFGDAEVFSFHATKFVNAGEGGAIATNDDELADRVRLMRNFGFAGYDDVVDLGTNGKMSELAAAMGLTSLESLEAFAARNRENHAAYAAGLAGIPGITLLRYDAGERRNCQYVVCEVDERDAGLSRDALQCVLQADGVLARRYFHPGCHRMEPYRSAAVGAGAVPVLPVTERLAARVLALPTGTAVGAPEIATICGIVARAVADAPRVRARLACPTA